MQKRQHFIKNILNQSRSCYSFALDNLTMELFDLEGSFGKLGWLIDHFGTSFEPTLLICKHIS
jgi:hypothetical protein